MANDIQPLRRPADLTSSDWEAKARVAQEARRESAERRRGRPASFVAAIGLGHS
ncbi:MAG: hypothetical protein QM582_04025 [Micropruina sp.]|uniref:hypothetical protein n=1 Tax=Micropruina sp. TaxID=2737536 RepID=UPI0039E6E0DB